jgi:chemotaxis protein CheX
MTDQNEAAVFVLPDHLDMQAAVPLQAALLALRGAGVSVDASGVEKLGGQCLQVLLAARKCWDEAGQDFTIAAMSDSFAAALAGFGVAPARLNTEHGVGA